MSRIARFVVPGHPHYVTQRGNRNEALFFRDEDYELYRELMGEQCRRQGVKVWAYCLMPNHVHLICAPETEEGLSRAVGETHRRYSAVINARLRVTGHLFRSRFSSALIDDHHWLMAARHVALNPVRVRLVQRAEDWRWSSAPAHAAGEDDALVTVAPLLGRLGGVRFDDWLAEPCCREAVRALRAAETIGRPIGAPDFLETLVALAGRDPRPKRRGPKPGAMASLASVSAGRIARGTAGADDAN